MANWIIGCALFGVLFAIVPGAAIAQPGAFANITEFPVPGAQPFRITAGSDGALWFTELAANKIGRITTGGTIRAREEITLLFARWRIDRVNGVIPLAVEFMRGDA